MAVDEPMTYYRLYFMDAQSGHIDHFRELNAGDDSAAIAMAEDARTLSPMELWSGRKKIRRWEAIPAGGAAFETKVPG